jgi:hypothetical protein
MPPETCPWSLSGPQFPTPTAIQQRYCYPKGNPEYSSIKGGALWTAYKENGAEDFDWRILHVYFSAKRAGNKVPTIQSTCSGGLHLLNSSSSSSRAKRPRLSSSSTTTQEQQQILSLPMPALDTPERRNKMDSFGSSFDDSPLSFNMPVSPLKDASLVSILSKTASIDTDSEPIISPERNFFDIQTEFEKTHGSFGEAKHHDTSSSCHYTSSTKRQKKTNPVTSSKLNIATPSSSNEQFSRRRRKR